MVGVLVSVKVLEISGRSWPYQATRPISPTVAHIKQRKENFKNEKLDFSFLGDVLFFFLFAVVGFFFFSIFLCFAKILPLSKARYTG